MVAIIAPGAVPVAIDALAAAGVESAVVGRVVEVDPESDGDRYSEGPIG
jgi:hypothetical protein